MPRVHRLLALLLVLFCGISFASDNRFIRLDPVIINTRIQGAPREFDQRLAMLKNNFQSAGCKPEQITEQAVPGQTLPNLFCTLPGKEEGTIVIAARFDFKSKGNELKVDSATLNLLPLLAQSLYTTGRRYTFVFAAFTGYERRVGSAYYLSQLTDAQKKAMRGMVFLDHLGRTPVHYMFPAQWNDSNIAAISRDVTETNFGGKRSTHPDNVLRRQFSRAAKDVNQGDPDELSEFFFTDALNFEHANVMALTLSSPAYGIIVRDFGQMEIKMPRTELDIRTYYETYNLLCIYSLYLDNTLAAGKY